MKRDIRYGNEIHWISEIRKGPYGLLERSWRTLARDLALHHGVSLLVPDAMSQLSQDFHWYLEPRDLLAPWSPRLLLVLAKAMNVVENYSHWADVKKLDLAWCGENADSTLPSGEQVFKVAIQSFKDAGLDTWIERIHRMRESYRKRVAWMKSDIHWIPFQVDINSPSVFLNVHGPDVWQYVVDKVRDDRSSWRGFLQDMRMGSLDYTYVNIPGHFRELSRQHDDDLPLGYGVSVQTPTFGYRREHRSNIILASWAMAQGMDLFGDQW